jgi:arylsulfatase
MVGSADFAEDRWELYHIADDYSEAVDLAAQHPDKLREFQDLFMAEAAKYNVLPLDDRFIERADVTLRPSYFYGRQQVTMYPGMIRLPEGSAPKTHNLTHTITVTADLPDGAEGVLACLGGDTAGWSLFIQDGRLVYHYNWFDVERYEVRSTRPVPTGKVELQLAFDNEGKAPGGPATARLFINGQECGQGRVDKQVRGRFSLESLDIGMDALSPVSKSYPEGKPHFPFTGTIDKVRFDFGDGVDQSPAEKLEQHIKMD